MAWNDNLHPKFLGVGYPDQYGLGIFLDGFSDEKSRQQGLPAAWLFRGLHPQGATPTQATASRLNPVGACYAVVYCVPALASAIAWPGPQ